MVYHRVFLYSVVYMYVQTYIHKQTSECVFWKRFRCPPHPPPAPYRSDSAVQKQANRRATAATKCVILFFF